MKVWPDFMDGHRSTDASNPMQWCLKPGVEGVKEMVEWRGPMELPTTISRRMVVANGSLFPLVNSILALVT